MGLSLDEIDRHSGQRLDWLLAIESTAQQVEIDKLKKQRGLVQR